MGLLMSKLSETSLARLATCHPDLIKLAQQVSQTYNITVTCGHRGEAEQEDAFNRGFSKLQFPQSKHNKYPSLAVDIVPFPIDWNDRQRFYHLAGFIQATAKMMGIKIRWGGDFNRDNNFKNDSFVDLPHYELEQV